MQNLLVMNGFSCTADGIFGKETERKLREFQQASGTNASGVADIMTQNAG